MTSCRQELHAVTKGLCGLIFMISFKPGSKLKERIAKIRAELMFPALNSRDLYLEGFFYINIVVIS